MTGLLSTLEYMLTGKSLVLISNYVQTGVSIALTLAVSVRL